MLFLLYMTLIWPFDSATGSWPLLIWLVLAFGGVMLLAISRVRWFWGVAFSIAAAGAFAWLRVSEGNGYWPAPNFLVLLAVTFVLVQLIVRPPGLRTFRFALGSAVALVSAIVIPVLGTLYDARLWFNACRVPGVSDAFYAEVGNEVAAFLKQDPRLQRFEFERYPAILGVFDARLSEWFRSKEPAMRTTKDKLAYMDAVFRALPMQYDGVRSSYRLVFGQARDRMPLVVYRFSWRQPADRLTSYRGFNLEWRPGNGQELGDFVQVRSDSGGGFLQRVLQRSRYPGASLCPEAPGNI